MCWYTLLCVCRNMGKIYMMEKKDLKITEWEIEMLMDTDSSNWPFAETLGCFAEARFVTPIPQSNGRRRVLCVWWWNLWSAWNRGSEYPPLEATSWDLSQIREKADEKQTLQRQIMVFVMQRPLLHNWLTLTTVYIFTNWLFGGLVSFHYNLPQGIFKQEPDLPLPTGLVESLNLHKGLFLDSFPPFFSCYLLTYLGNIFFWCSILFEESTNHTHG